MNENSIQEKIREWALGTQSNKGALEIYNELGDKYQNNFYTQSNLRNVTSTPELLVMGLNPGSGGVYKGHVDIETFLSGNPYYADHRKWRMWRLLNSILSRVQMGDIINDEKRYVWSNVVWLDTPKISNLPRKAFDDCANVTKGFIRALSPKIMLCLGKDSINTICENYACSIECMIPGEIFRSWVDNTLLIGIPHTSKLYTHEEMDLVAHGIKLLTETPKMSKDDFVRSLSMYIEAFQNRKSKASIMSVNNKEIADTFKNRNVFKMYNNKSEHYELTNDLEFTVSHTKPGYVAIRHKNYKGKYSTNSYSYADEIRNILKQYGYDIVNNDVWLGTKTFKEYNGEVVDGIIVELKEIKEKLNQI